MKKIVHFPPTKCHQEKQNIAKKWIRKFSKLQNFDKFYFRCEFSIKKNSGFD